MQLKFDKERVMAVVAHPDDAELLCAGTLARAKADGAEIAVCVLCQGDKGQSDPPLEDLGQVRSAEMSAAGKVLGAELYEAGFLDGELLDAYQQRLILIEIFRKFRPTLVLAHSRKDYHPDHQQASALAEAASWFCASDGHPTPSPAMQAGPPDLWWMDTINMNQFDPGFFIDVSDHLELKQQMLACHKSQLARGADADFSPLADLMRAQFTARGNQAGVHAAEAFQLHLAWKRASAW
ncbi:MAG: PIG-L family deacetylase [Verrucomicrobiales bacterium]|nr:PIG-L family deacetylase [Verrucomicrobiales bacterium]